MARPEFILDRRIIPGPLVFVFNQQAYGRARCPALKHSGQDPDLIGLPALGDMTGLARFAPVQVALQISLTQFHSRRAAVNNAQVPVAVAFPTARYRKQLSDSIT